MPLTTFEPSNCINHLGEVDIHLAIEKNISEVDLARAKFHFMVANISQDASGCQDHLRRLMTNHERAEESRHCWMKEEIGTPKARYYHYRYTYYLELVQVHRNHLTGVLVDGFKSRK